MRSIVCIRYILCYNNGALRVFVMSRVRHTPARLRPNCIKIRKDLDPFMYPTREALHAAIANGTFRREFGCLNEEEVEAANKDCLI